MAPIIIVVIGLDKINVTPFFTIDQAASKANVTLPFAGQDAQDQSACSEKRGRAKKR